MRHLENVLKSAILLNVEEPKRSVIMDTMLTI